MHWFSTALLIALTAGTAAWTGWLLRRLFVVEPAPAAEPVVEPVAPTRQATDEANAEEPNA